MVGIRGGRRAAPLIALLGRPGAAISPGAGAGRGGVCIPGGNALYVEDQRHISQVIIEALGDGQDKDWTRIRRKRRK